MYICSFVYEVNVAEFGPERGGGHNEFDLWALLGYFTHNYSFNKAISRAICMLCCLVSAQVGFIITAAERERGKIK